MDARNRRNAAPIIMLGLVLALGFAGMAQDAAPEVAPEVAPEAVAETVPDPVLSEPASSDALAPLPDGVVEVHQLTLMDMIEQGGAILWVIMALGFVALVMSVYFFFTVTAKREVPPNFLKRTLSQLRSGDLRGAYQMCEGRDELLVNVVRAGLKMAGHDRYVIQDAMESEGERGATALWQKISWLNNIGVIAPLLGLLGTVWGMIQAFSVIALDNAQVKSMAMAFSVSKAMITTAGGLLLAIPVLFVYYYMRGRVIKIIAEVEAHSSVVVEVLTRGQEQ
ncbi:MAG TPA: MotA/TolQ/ExbB proton channel family protein [Candidatus Hydrogenedentes bacterium]|nr:MotA/TolQ/ExbB proton channel family protein [Candidatus Hydrogenedentota bacterium]